jgi:hypothetical protein
MSNITIMSNSNRNLGTMNYRTVLFISLIAVQSVFSGYADQQNTGASEATNDIQEIKKPSESEAIEAALKYLNRDGQMSIKETEFIAWGTYNKQQAYWPIKLRMVYKSKGFDDLRHNEYAVKISKDATGKWKAGQYYAWRTDFK